MRYLLICIAFLFIPNNSYASCSKESVGKVKIVKKVKKPFDHYYSYYRFRHFNKMLEEYNKGKAK